MVLLGIVGCDKPAMLILGEQGGDVQVEEVCAFSQRESGSTGTGIEGPPVHAGNGHFAGEASGGSVAFSPNSRGKRCARSGSRHQPSSPRTIPGCAW